MSGGIRREDGVLPAGTEFCCLAREDGVLPTSSPVACCVYRVDGVYPSGVTQTVTLFGTGDLPTSDYYSAYDGQPEFPQLGSYLTLNGMDAYVWFSKDNGSGTYWGVDPGLFEAGLSGFTGYEVQLVSGARTPTQVAAATDTVVAAIPGISATSQSGADLTITGSFTSITPGATTWSGRGGGGLWGWRWAIPSTASSGDESTYAEGGVSTVICQHATAPSSAGRVIAFDVYIGGAASAGASFRVALYTGGTTTSPVNAVLTYDFGRIGAGASTDGWYRLYVDPGDSVTFSGSENWWLAVKDNANVTFIGGSTDIVNESGDFTAQPYRNSTSTMSTDPSVAWEGTWVGTINSPVNFVLGLRVIYQLSPYVSDGSWERVWGVHNPTVAGLGSEVDIANIVGAGNTVPNVEGLQLEDVSVCVGTVNPAGEEFRVGVYQGGSGTTAPIWDSATLVADLGQLGTGTQTWITVNASQESLSAGALTWICFKNDNGTTGPRIRYAPNGVNLALADDRELPWDFVLSGPARSTIAVGTNGSEYETGGGTPMSINETVAYEGTFTGDATDTHPGNMPGVRLTMSTPALTVV